MKIPVILRNGEIRYFPFDHERPPDYNEIVVETLPSIADMTYRQKHMLPPLGLITKLLTWREEYEPPPMITPKRKHLPLKLYEFGIGGTAVPFFLYVEVDSNPSPYADCTCVHDRNRFPMSNQESVWPDRWTHQDMLDATILNRVPTYHRRFYQCDWVVAEPNKENDVDVSRKNNRKKIER